MLFSRKNSNIRAHHNSNSVNRGRSSAVSKPQKLLATSATSRVTSCRHYSLWGLVPLFFGRFQEYLLFIKPVRLSCLKMRNYRCGVPLECDPYGLSETWATEFFQACSQRRRVYILLRKQQTWHRQEPLKLVSQNSRNATVPHPSPRSRLITFLFI